MKAPPALAVLLSLFAVAAARAALTPDQERQVLDEAQSAYDRGVAILRTDRERALDDFRVAGSRFQQLADDGVANGFLHYNLANAYLQAGELGRAILHYRAAERLVPGDPRLAHNLEHARSLRRSNIAPAGRPRAGALLSWHHGTSTRTRFTVFESAYVLLWLVLLLRVFRPYIAWRWLAAAAGAVSIATGASVGADLGRGREDLAGVVLADDVVVRKGNGEGFEPQFAEPLHEAVEFELLDRRPGWLRIELPDGKSGWIREDQAGLVG